jgi:outer membrane protein
LKKLLGSFLLSAVLSGTLFSLPLHAFGVDVSVQGEQITPSGNLGYKAQGFPSNRLSLQDDLGFDKVNTMTARIRVEWPIPLIPSIYLQATPLKFSGSGARSASFQYGDRVFSAAVPYSTSLKLDHYDFGIFYGVPFLKTATNGILDVDWGINLRVVDYKAEVLQPTTGLSESKSQTVPVPMGYLGLRVSPIDPVTVYGELRGIGYADNRYVDLAAGAKVKVFMFAYVGAGYKYQNFKINYADVDSDLRFGGPYAEVGVSF